SPRYGERLLGFLREDGVHASLVTGPNLDDSDENAYRETLLDRHRGWLRREGLFAGLPLEIDWSRAALTPDEVLAIRYINWDWWLVVSGGTRLPLDTAERISRQRDRGRDRGRARTDCREASVGRPAAGADRGVTSRPVAARAPRRPCA